MNFSKSYVYRNGGQKIQKTMLLKNEKAMFSPNSALAIIEEQVILKWIKGAMKHPFFNHLSM